MIITSRFIFVLGFNYTMLHTIGNPSESQTASSSPAVGMKYGAGRIIQAGQEAVHYVNTNPTALNFLGAVGGGATMAVGVLCFMNIFSAFRNPLTYTLNVFYIFIGVVLVVTSLFGSSNLSQNIYSQANFLSNPVGRSLLYLYLGCVMTASSTSGVLSWLYLAVGIYMLILALISFFVGWRQRRMT